MSTSQRWSPEREGREAAVGRDSLRLPPPRNRSASRTAPEGRADGAEREGGGGVYISSGELVVFVELEGPALPLPGIRQQSVSVGAARGGQAAGSGADKDSDGQVGCVELAVAPEPGVFLCFLSVMNLCVHQSNMSVKHFDRSRCLT